MSLGSTPRRGRRVRADNDRARVVSVADGRRSRIEAGAGACARATGVAGRVLSLAEGAADRSARAAVGRHCDGAARDGGGAGPGCAERRSDRVAGGGAPRARARACARSRCSTSSGSASSACRSSSGCRCCSTSVRSTRRVTPAVKRLLDDRRRVALAGAPRAHRPFVLLGELVGNRGPLVLPPAAHGAGRSAVRDGEVPHDDADGGRRASDGGTDHRRRSADHAVRRAAAAVPPRRAAAAAGTSSAASSRSSGRGPSSPTSSSSSSAKIPFYGLRHLVRPGSPGGRR